MDPIIPPLTPDKSKHNKKETTVLVVLLVLLLIGIGAGLFLTLQSKPVSIQERAQERTDLNTNALICPDDGATCSWDSQEGVTSYSYQIVDQTTGATVKTGTTQDTKVSFTPIVNHAYKCTVKAINQCGEGPSGSAVNTCVGVSTPTPTEAITETPTPTKEITPTPTIEFIPTQTPTPTVEIVVSSTTPTPTEIIVVQIQPTETPTSTISQTPPPPTSGSNTGVLFMVVSAVILVSLMLVF